MFFLALIVGALLGLLAFGCALYLKWPMYVALSLAAIVAFTLTFATYGSLTEDRSPSSKVVNIR